MQGQGTAGSRDGIAARSMRLLRDPSIGAVCGDTVALLAGTGEMRDAPDLHRDWMAA
jgi:hypothetical protein